MNTGSVLAQFTITLSKAVSEPVAVEWFTSDGTAKAGVDYAANKGTALFVPGDTAKTVDILVYGRAVGAEDRSFFVEMLPPTNAVLGASIGECIIHVDATGSQPVTQIIIPTGPKGDEGESSYETWLKLPGNAGKTEQEFIDSLKPSPQEIAQEVAPLLDVGDTMLTADGTEALSRPDRMNVKQLARRAAYARPAKISTVVLADGDNTIQPSNLSGDTADFSSPGFIPRILRNDTFIEANWRLNTNGSIIVYGAIAGDVLYATQYNFVSEKISSTAEPSRLTRHKSFEKGSSAIKTSLDALLWEAAPNGQGPYFIWTGAFPKGVPAGSTPATTGGIGAGKWMDAKGATLYSDISQPDGYKLIGEVQSFDALRNLVPTATGQKVRLKGWNAGSSQGGGEFVSELVAEADNGGTIASNGSGYVWRRTNVLEVTPFMFGARGNGTTDDTDAVNKAMLSGSPVFFPPGQFLITGVCGSSTTTVGVSVRGSGDQSILFYGATNARLNLVGDGAKVSNLWFRAKVAAVGAYITFGDVNAVIDTNGGMIENCIFGDEQTTFYAIHYIRCLNVWYSTIQGNHFRGIGNGTASVTGIYSYYSVNVSCTANTFLFMGRCIVWDPTAAPGKGFHNEGWVIGNNAAAAIYTFFHSNNGLAAHINNNIIDICFGPAIYSDAGTTRITDNWIAAQDTNTQGYLVYLSGGFSVIHTNRFVGQVGIATCIQIAGSPEHVQIQDNSIFGCGTGASVSTAAPYLVFSGNTALSQSQRSWDLSKATFMTYFGNSFRNSVNATFPFPLMPTTGSNIIKKKWTTSFVASLQAGTSGQDFNIPLPANLFSDKPYCQATIASGTIGLVIAYVYDSSTTSVAVMRLMNPAGTALPATNYRICVEFTDPYY